MLIASVCVAGESSLLVVRPDGSWPPWETVVNGEPAGIHVEMVQSVSKALGVPVVIQSYPWLRAIRMLKQGEADAITYMSRTAEREQFGYFMEGNILSSTRIGLFILKSNERKLSFSGDLSSLKGYKLGTCRGFSYGEMFDNANFLDKDNGAEDEYALLKMLAAGHVQIAVGYVGDMKFAAEKLGMADSVSLLSPVLSERRDLYLVFSKAKQHQELARRFSEAMKAYKQKPEYRELLRKYGVSE
ncbi:MAG TPA: transporter substrate-binding domain-containing protein [Ideonella sp.]|uniref:substrate-binding periplasmic protein n=1 Tax=Ideonella sp. TaxID=1929293 RepID=UPI002E3388D4|nr:transporter substrate-binding domain-containing protein [Ideonella sp.]HEX5684207.1 transporter substrate-binding domain-containing protein [Ideonella sp.]